MVKPVQKPVVSTDEEIYRKSNFPDVKKLVNKKNILCTSCNRSVKPLILKGKPKCHPFMDTLLCEKCFVFFGDGEFSVDEDGSDKYCRWCGQGGTLFLCSKCTAGFCKKCIKRNLPRSALKEVEEDDWECFCCNVKPLYELRGYCWAAMEFSGKDQDKVEDITRKRKHTAIEEGDSEDKSHSKTSKVDSKSKKRKSSRLGKAENKKESEDDNDNNESGDNQSINDIDELEDTDKSENKTNQTSKINENKQTRNEKKLYKKITTKFDDVFNDALQISDKVQTKALECKKHISNFKTIKDVKTLENAANGVVRMLEQIESIYTDMRINFKEYVDNWKSDLAQELDKKEVNEKPKIKDEEENVEGNVNLENGELSTPTESMNIATESTDIVVVDEDINIREEVNDKEITDETDKVVVEEKENVVVDQTEQTAEVPNVDVEEDGDSKSDESKQNEKQIVADQEGVDTCTN